MEHEDTYLKPTETLRRIRRGEGDGFPGPDYRVNIAAQWMAEMLYPKIIETVDELMTRRTTGFDFDNTGDLLDFREAVIAGLQISLEKVADELAEE